MSSFTSNSSNSLFIRFHNDKSRNYAKQHVFWLELLIIPKLWNVTKDVIVTKTWHKLESVICTKIQNREFLWIWHGFLLKVNDLQDLEKKEIIIFVPDTVILKKMLWKVFSIDISTRHRMSCKNVDLNICAHIWHSV